MDVPLRISCVVSPIREEDTILDPGASKSTQLPWFENDELNQSSSDTDATVKTCEETAGASPQANAWLFPAAAITVMP